MKKLISVIGGILLGGAIALAPAAAQDYPKKQPIKIVVGYSAGGLTDVLARIIGDFLSKRMGQAVVVENRTGASGAVGAGYVASAAPDGYTLLMSVPDVAVLPAVRSDLPFKTEDFTYLVRVLTTEPVMVISPKLPFSTFEELIKYAKENPGKIRYATPGVGHWVHLESAAFEKELGVKMTHVPYAGIAPAYTDMLAGNVDITLAATPPFPEELKVLGTLAKRRHPAFPNAPTIGELGHDKLTYSVWFGLEAPKGLPKPIADKLIAEITAVMKDPEAIAKFQAAAKVVPDPDPLTGDAFRDSALAESKNWKAIADSENIKVQQ